MSLTPKYFRSDHKSMRGPKFSENIGPADQFPRNFGLPDQNFRRTKISVTILLKWLKQLSLCPVVLVNLGNKTVNLLCLFAMYRLNYNHFQDGGITTQSWSQSIRGTRCLRTTPGTHTYRSFSQNGRSESRRNLKIVLNSTPTTDFLLWVLPVHMAFYFYKCYSFPF